MLLWMSQSDQERWERFWERLALELLLVVPLRPQPKQAKRHPGRRIPLKNQVPLLELTHMPHPHILGILYRIIERKVFLQRPTLQARSLLLQSTLR